MSTRTKTSKKRPAPRPSRIHAPGYGFPTTTKGLLPWSWAEQRLKKSHNFWMTTVKSDGAPHTMVVWAMWADGRLLISTGSESKKAKNLAANPHCVICTENAAEAVIVEGVAENADLAQRRKLVAHYERKYKFDMSTMKDDIFSMKEPVYAVRPRVVFGLYEKKFQQSATRWIFE